MLPFDEEEENAFSQDIKLAELIAQVRGKEEADPYFKRVHAPKSETHIYKQGDILFEVVVAQQCSAEEAKSVLQSCLSAEWSKIIVVYGGHGEEDGSLCFNGDTTLSKEDLKSTFTATAPSGAFFINSCYSNLYAAERWDHITCYPSASNEEPELPLSGIVGVSTPGDIVQQYTKNMIENCVGKELKNILTDNLKRLTSEIQEIFRASWSPKYDSSKIQEYNENASMLAFSAGTGICTMLKDKDVCIMFDAGEGTKFGESAWKFICSYVNKIDLWVISHSDDDHIMGLSQMLRRKDKPTIESVL